MAGGQCPEISPSVWKQGCDQVRHSLPGEWRARASSESAKPIPAAALRVLGGPFSLRLRDAGVVTGGLHTVIRVFQPLSTLTKVSSVPPNDSQSQKIHPVNRLEEVVSSQLALQMRLWGQ